MDEFGPEKKIGMIVDEWGTWFTCEPGTNPGFLYQQNTVRDALVAGLTLNIFNKHSDRVKMANLAQMVNVLQAVILTEGEQMIKTPTYHVFHQYRYHQGGELLKSELTGVGTVGTDEWKLPEITESVSEDAEGVITITLSNACTAEAQNIDIELAEGTYEVAEATVVTGEMHAHNRFEAPDVVTEREFTAYEVKENGLSAVLPPASVTMIRLKRQGM
jgi:alpha-N-arabinofuranosidase